MVELGQLESRHQDFAKKGIRLVVVSDDDQAAATKTQKDFPHLVVIADTDHKLANAVAVLQPGMGKGGTDTNAPTTVFTDSSGTVRWIFRPDRFISRLSPDELLQGIQEHWQ
jgi:alkyl hydroperoxide reductase subunit AhpC